MNRGIIAISETGAVTMPTAPVWMTQFEIADLFGVFSCDVRKVIHAIYKNKELNEVETMKYVKQPDGISYDVYSLEMVIAVAFRICSIDSMSFRRFVMGKVCKEERDTNDAVRFLWWQRRQPMVLLSFIPSFTRSRCTDAKVVRGFGGSSEVGRQCRFGQNLPQTSLSVFSPKTLPLPATH